MLLIYTLVTVALLTPAALLAATETAVMLLSSGRVHRLVEAQVKGADRLETLFESKHRLRAASALCAGIGFAAAGFTGMAAGTEAFSAFATAIDQSIVSLVAPYVISGVAGAVLAVFVAFSVAQALPRTLAAGNPEQIGLQGARFALPLVAGINPVARFFGAPWRWVAGLFGAESTPAPWAVSAEGRGAESDEDSERDETEEALYEAVSGFGEKVVREVMVPRTDVSALADTSTLTEAVHEIERTGYSRLPVYHQSIDDIRGIVYAKDLLVALATRGSTGDTRISRLARTPYFVPETKPVEELLHEMRTRTHIAVVADEYGGTAGIITLEDLLEEIVGEIADEYDREEPLIVDLGDGRYRLDARLPVDDLNDIFDTDLDTEADSVGGLFIETSGHIPALGESIDIEGLRLTVTDRQETRIRQLVVEPAPRVEGESRA